MEGLALDLGQDIMDYYQECYSVKNFQEQYAVNCVMPSKTRITQTAHPLVSQRLRVPLGNNIVILNCPYVMVTYFN